jgi:uncharacterized membrane protein (DUF4010 family)
VLAFILWRRAAKEKDVQKGVALGNPFELRPALFFAAMIAAISIASGYAASSFGSAGLYAIAALSGVADVDAMTLSAGRQAATGEVEATVAGVAVLIAVGANIVSKAAMAATIGGRKTGAIVLASFATIAAASAIAAFAMIGND